MTPHESAIAVVGSFQILKAPNDMIPKIAAAITTAIAEERYRGQAMTPDNRASRGHTPKKGKTGSHRRPSKREVRLFPLPIGSNPALVDLIGRAVAGAVKSALTAHVPNLSASECGMLVGSIRKRVVNQLVCREGEACLREALDPIPAEETRT